MHITRRDLVLLALSGILGMTVAGVTFLFGIKLIGASKAVALSSSSPVWTSLFSILFLKEKVTLRVVASSILVVVGIYFLT
jgi:drug/metabolite transporter (DMT)-like permease